MILKDLIMKMLDPMKESREQFQKEQKDKQRQAKLKKLTLKRLKRK